MLDWTRLYSARGGTPGRRSIMLAATTSNINPNVANFWREGTENAASKDTEDDLSGEREQPGTMIHILPDLGRCRDLKYYVGNS